MQRSMFLLASVLAWSRFAVADEFAGTYTTTPPGAKAPITLTLTKGADGNYAGTLAGNGTNFDLKAFPKAGGDGATGTARLNGQFASYIELSRQGGQLVLSLIQAGPGGEPDPAHKSAIAFPAVGGNGNPAAPDNPGAVTNGATAYAGIWKNDQLTIELNADAGGYGGTIHLGANNFPLKAAGADGTLQGTFSSGADNFDFTATLRGTTLTVTTGGAAYQLQRQGGNPLANPLAHPAPGNPLANPGAAPAAMSASTLDAASLTQLTQKFKGNMRREAKDKVLVAGKPPLTYGSVAAFANLVSRVLDIELTEAEFEATRLQFMDAYRKGDAPTKATLALVWQQLVDALDQGTPEQQAANLVQARATMEDRFAAGAEAGVRWAQVIQAAIARRTQSLKTVTAPRPAFAQQTGFDSKFSAADLDASMEMLYFMWVNAGRDPQLVTPETVATVRTLLVQNFAQFPPDLQYVLANGQKVYTGVRTAWANASPAQRQQMAQGFGQSLDALGLTVPAPARQAQRQGTGAWADWEGKTHGEFAAEMVVGLAGGSYHSAW